MSSGHVRAVMVVIFAKPADGTGIPLSKRLPLWGSLMSASLRGASCRWKPSACASPDCLLVYCDEVVMVRVL